MRLPALWIAAAFAVGIECARLRPFSPAVLGLVALGAMLCAGLLVWRRNGTAWAVTLLAWIAVGGCAFSLDHAMVPRDSVTRLIAEGRLDTAAPLRWQGRLRADPQERPWGQQYEIELEQVVTPDRTVPVNGGLRASLYGERADKISANLRAGDQVEALLKANQPRNFQDPGAFDERAYLATQGIDLTGSLRNERLLLLIERARPNWHQRLARAHSELLARVDRLFAGQPEAAAVLRAMLLGDRSFVDTNVATAFQQTGVYHVLVVAGLHTGALVIFLVWLCRRARLHMPATILVTLAGLAGYVSIVQDRPPIVRAACIAAFYLLAGPLFRRVDLLNTVALVALAMLIWKPELLGDSSFQLSFLAAGVIAALALPWIERTSAPYRAGLAHLGDVTRDVVYPPQVAQFRIEMRAAIDWFANRLPKRLAGFSPSAVTTPMRVALRFWELLLLSLAIQLGMLPLLAQDFHRISLVAPLGNIPVVLLTGIIVPFGFFVLAVSYVSFHVAAACAHFLASLTLLLLHTVNWIAQLPHVSYRVPGPPIWLAVAFLAALGVLAFLGRKVALQQRDRKTRRRLREPMSLAEIGIATVATALAILIAWFPFAPRLARNVMEMTILDVGQGDSVFVAFPNGRTMLVDGGGLAGSEWIKGMRSGLDVGEDVVSPYLWSRGLKSIDVVVLTHGHQDHIGGLSAVLQNFTVHELWIGRDEDSAEFQELLREARERGIRIVPRTQGQDVSWDRVTGEVLWPPAEETATNASNDDSLVIRLRDGDSRFLLTGDIEQPVERAILARGGDLSADFLKVPHHGSKTSSTPNFLNAVQPRLAVISVGAGNAYGHPSEEVIGRYENDGVQLLRTDRDGAVTLKSDGHKIFVSEYATRTNREILARATDSPSRNTVSVAETGVQIHADQKRDDTQ